MNEPALIHDPEIEQTRVNMHELIEQASRCEITDRESAGRAAGLLKNIKQCRDAIEEKRKELTKPQLTAKKQQDAFFKELQSPSAKAIDYLEGQFKAWAPIGESIVGEYGSAIVNELAPTIEVTDPDAVPDEYMMTVVNMDALKAAYDDGRDVPGVTFTKRLSVTSR